MKLSIELGSFFRRGLPKIPEQEGLVLLFTGKQGSGKTFAAVKFALERTDDELPIYANFHIDSPRAHYLPFDDILRIDTSSSVVIIDEIFTRFTKTDKVDKSFTSWMAQCRKNNRVAILIAQEFLETPLVLRRFGRYLVSCKKILGMVLEGWSDGNTLHYDSDLGEYVADPYKMRIYKRTLDVGQRYDTLEKIV